MYQFLRKESKESKESKDSARPHSERVTMDERIYLTYVTAAFDTFDKDKSGFISSAELNACLEGFSAQAKRPKPEKGELQKIFDKYDANKNRNIDYKEFSKMASEIFNIDVLPGSKSQYILSSSKLSSIQCFHIIHAKV